MKKLIEKCKKVEDLTIYLTLFSLYKSYLLLISDKEEMGIGNVSLGIPQTIDGIKSSSTSYAYFGIKQKLLSTIIVEKSSHVLKAPVLLLLFLHYNS